MKYPKWNTSYNLIRRKFLRSFHFFSSVYKNTKPPNFKLISQNTRNISIKGFCNCWNVFVSHRISSTRFCLPRALEIFGNIEVTEVPIVGNEAIRQALQVYRLLDFERTRWLFRPIRPAFCRCKPNVVLQPANSTKKAKLERWLVAIRIDRIWLARRLRRFETVQNPKLWFPIIRHFTAGVFPSACGKNVSKSVRSPA